MLYCQSWDIWHWGTFRLLRSSRHKRREGAHRFVHVPVRTLEERLSSLAIEIPWSDCNRYPYTTAELDRLFSLFSDRFFTVGLSDRCLGGCVLRELQTVPELVTHARKKIPGHVRWGIVLLSALVSRPTDGRYYVRGLDKRAMVEKV